jgi:hypothetical protein
MAWTTERVAALSTDEVRQLRLNAERLRNEVVLAICDEVLRTRPQRASSRAVTRQKELDGRPLVSRKKAFEMRGVTLRNPRWSWGGVRPADGTVVFTIWANEIQAANGIYRYMLWGPNRGGDQPWSDTPGGRERLEHSRLAFEKGEAEGVLIYGQTQGGDLPLGEASRVSGADPSKVLRFKVRQEGDEYWAVWGTETATS